MELWARWLVAILALAIAVTISVFQERRVLSLLVTASRRSAWRAAGVLLGFHAVLVVAGVLATWIVLAVRDTSETAGVLLTGLFFVPLGALTLPLMPGTVGPISYDAHSSGTLRRRRATVGVSRVLGLGGAVLWFVVVAPLWTLAVVGVFVGPQS